MKSAYRALRAGKKIPKTIAHCLVLGAFLIGMLAVGTGCSESPVQGNPNPDPIPTPEVEAPSPPSSLTAESRNGQIELVWEGPEDADAYLVYRATSPIESLPDQPVSDKVESASFTDNGVANGTTYYYRVTAIAESAGGEAESDASNESAATPFPSPPERP